MRRRHFIAASVTAAALGAPSISRGQSAKVLRLVPQADLALLDPIQSTVNVTRNHGFMVFDTLYGIDMNLRPQPQMVDGHTVSDDGKTWELTLRDGLMFHDGTPVLARDAVASIKRWGNRDQFGRSMMSYTDEVAAPSDRMIRIRLKRPFPLLPAALAKMQTNMCAIMPERLARTDPYTQVTEMVGSGPFRFVAAERVPGSRVVYEKNRAYVPRPNGEVGFTSGPKIVNVDRVEWLVIPDPATAAAAIQSGEVDWIERPIPDLLPVLRKNADILVKRNDPFGNMETFRLNHLQPPFNNPAIRRAILGAIDQTEIMSAVAGEDHSLWRAGIGVFPPGSPWANDAGMEVLNAPRDYDRVKRELAAAGYDGSPVVMLVGTDVPDIEACSQVGAAAFKRAGLNVDYRALDWGTVTQRIGSQKPLADGGWSCFFVPNRGDDDLDPSVNGNLRGLGLKGYPGWPTSAGLETLQSQWLEATDDTTRMRICRDIQLQVWQDVPYVPLGSYFLPMVFRRNVSGVVPGFAKFWGVTKA